MPDETSTSDIKRLNKKVSQMEEEDPDIKRLNEKTKKGALNIVSDVLADPQVQNTIKTALFRETIKNSIVLTCLLVGLLKLYDVSKTVIGFDWRGDLLMSAILVSVGLVYMLKNTVLMKKNGNAKATHRNFNVG